MGYRPNRVMQFVKNRDAAINVFLTGQSDELRDVHAFQSTLRVGKNRDNRFAGLIYHVAYGFNKFFVRDYFDNRFFKHPGKCFVMEKQ